MSRKRLVQSEPPFFGEAYGRFHLGKHEELICRELYDLSMRLGMKSSEASGPLDGKWDKGQEFKNDVFEMHQQVEFGRLRCTCKKSPHADDCIMKQPNFRCGDFEIRWYATIGRNMTANRRRVSANTLIKMFERCRESIT